MRVVGTAAVVVDAPILLHPHASVRVRRGGQWCVFLCLYTDVCLQTHATPQRSFPTAQTVEP